MKTFLLSTGLALGLGAAALTPAGAAPIVKSTLAVSSATSDVACRTVERRVRSNGVTRITRSRVCDNDRPRFVERRYRERDDRREFRREYRRNDGYSDRRYRRSEPGFSIRVN